MTAKVNLLTAAPDVMKVWTGAALAIAASLEPSLTSYQVNGAVFGKRPICSGFLRDLQSQLRRT